MCSQDLLSSTMRADFAPDPTFLTPRPKSRLLASSLPR